MLFLLFFFVDFFCFALVQQWLVSSLLVHLFRVSFHCYNNKELSVQWWLALIFFLLEDCFLHARFGVALLYLLPLFALVIFIKKMVRGSGELAVPLLVTIALITDQFVIKKLILGHNVSLLVTFMKISATLSVTYVVLLGMWGNRLLQTLFARERKVWTPNKRGVSREHGFK